MYILVYSMNGSHQKSKFHHQASLKILSRTNPQSSKEEKLIPLGKEHKDDRF